MSIRIGLYDFFAYTIPGIFYLSILGFWLNVSGLYTLDLNTLNSLSASFFILVLGAGYIVGLLLDPLAYNWMRLFQSRNRDAAKAAFKEFHEQHPWLVLDFESRDWGILLRAVKSKSLEAAIDVEQHNVAAIMLRNISFNLFLSAISSLVYFFAFSPSIWNFSLCVIFFVLAMFAITRSRIRRHWFYISIFEAFAAHFLLDEKLASKKPIKKPNTSSPRLTKKANDE